MKLTLSISCTSCSRQAQKQLATEAPGPHRRTCVLPELPQKSHSPRRLSVPQRRCVPSPCREPRSKFHLDHAASADQWPQLAEHRFRRSSLVRGGTQGRRGPLQFDGRAIDRAQTLRSLESPVEKYFRVLLNQAFFLKCAFGTI